MAKVSVVEDSFNLTFLGGNQVRVNLDFTVAPSSTESRLDIPSHVWVRLMEPDNDRDATHLRGDFISVRNGDDDPATGWMYAGLFSNQGPHSFSRTVNQNDLPGESGNEEWYCVVAARPDLFTDVNYTNQISANLA